MTKFMKRGLALFMVLAVCLTFLPTLVFGASAETVDYVYSGKYIYNWGERGELATFLSPNAEKFYSSRSVSYESLSAYAGGTGKSDAPNSALFGKLQDIMSNAHTHKTGYDETKELYKYTDCENSGGKISSFYSGTPIGPSWGNGWNREHTWPDSKGAGGSDEDDIMMLRPTSTSENSSRGNMAYGKSSGYYNPNSESGGKYDLRGDVARIFLYVYVRWGITNGNSKHSTWGSDGVMESVEVLLEWMEADPVDTWELGRNDSVESITGTRNVFVDYPELAFLLFGEEIPETMSTPSGSAGEKCGHNNFDSGKIVAATCTENGYTLFTCMTAGCGFSYKSNFTSSKGHTFVSGKCSVCGADEPVEPYFVTSPATGEAYKLGFFSTSTGSVHYFTGSMSTQNSYYGATDTSFDNGVDIFVESVSGGYRMYFKNSSGTKQYINLVVSGTHRNFTFASSATSTFTWDSAKNAMKTVLEGEDVYIGNYGTYTNVGTLQSSKLKDTDYIARLYTVKEGAGGESGGESGGNTSCSHNYTSKVTAPTCTNGGYTTYTCSLCGDSYTGNATAAKGHSYKDGSCITCGAKKPVSTSATISFASKDNREVFTTSQQVWKMNGVTVTNNKASASSNVGDYASPIRCYQGSDVIISYPGMTKIEIDCSGIESKYVECWKNVSGATVSSSNGIITIVFSSPTDSLTYKSLAKQSRANGITVYSEAAASCEHTKTSVSGGYAATCTQPGHTGITRCDACGEVIDEGSVIPKKGHDFGSWTQSVEPSCTEQGEERRNCNNCDEFETRPLDTVPHTDSNNDGICDIGGESLDGGTGSGSQGNSGSSDGQPNNSEPTDGDSSTVIIVCVAVGGVAVVGGGFALFRFIRRKRRGF